MEKTAEELKRCYGSWTIGFWMCSSDIFVEFDNVHDIHTNKTAMFKS